MPKHISEIIDDLRSRGELPHLDAPIEGFPCDVQITPEELDVDEYTREECRQSEFAFDCLKRELGLDAIEAINAEEAYDERRVFERTHPNAT
jgi:hypothetical protein